MGQARADARDTTGQLSGLAASAQLMETLEQRTTTINGAARRTAEWAKPVKTAACTGVATAAAPASRPRTANVASKRDFMMSPAVVSPQRKWSDCSRRRLSDLKCFTPRVT
jgi:hypothetical protein